MIEMVVDVVAVCLLGAGLTLATLGLAGILRMSDVLDQLHAAGLITGPAVICILAASIATGNAEAITSAVLVILFVFITSPLAAHAVAQEAYRNRADAESGENSARAERP